MTHLLEKIDPAAHVPHRAARAAARARARVANVALLLSFSLLSSHARQALGQEPPRAAPSPSDESLAEQRRIRAKAKYEQGVDAYAAGRYQDAVELFEAADKLSASAPLSFNIARAEERLGDETSALRWYRDYLRRGPALQNAEQVRATIATLAASLEKRGVQQLTVLSNPEGATVQVDNQPPVVAPWTGELRPGRHHLSFSRAGYADEQRDVELSASEPRDVSVQLEQKRSVPTVATGRTDTSGTAATQRPRLGALPWLTLGVGAAALGGALTFELLRRSAESDAKRETQVGYLAQLDREQSRQTAARVFLGVGGALVVAGGVMLLLDTKPKSRATSAAFFCVPQLCAASALGRF